MDEHLADVTTVCALAAAGLYAAQRVTEAAAALIRSCGEVISAVAALVRTWRNARRLGEAGPDASDSSDSVQDRTAR